MRHKEEALRNIESLDKSLITTIATLTSNVNTLNRKLLIEFKIKTNLVLFLKQIKVKYNSPPSK